MEFQPAWENCNNFSPIQGLNSTHLRMQNQLYTMSSIRFILVLVLGTQMLAGRGVFAEETALSPFAHGAPVEPATIQVDNQDAKAWQASSANKVLTFKPLETWRAPASGPLYLEVTYLDRGYGHLAVAYAGTDGKTDKADKMTHAYLLDSGKWVTCYMRLNGIALAAPPEIQISREKGTNDDLAIAKVGLNETPFADAHFQYLLDEAWMRPYTGTTVPPPDNTTLKGKIMVGYQGWFATPNDPYDKGGWSHWGDMPKKHFTTDMWPNPADYPPEALDKACDVKTLGGKQGYLFSSAWPEAVRVHFHWMKENNIDGAFVQRFAGSHSRAINGFPDWVLGNVRAAANQEGRLWAIEYDASGIADADLLPILQKDWIWLVDQVGITKDPNYARVNGKPVVFVWGPGIASRKFSPEMTAKVIDFFKNDPKYGGNYFIVGSAGDWKKLDAAWQDVFRKCDGIQGWMSTDYAADLAKCKELGIDYYGHVKPGFSWSNTMHIQTGSNVALTPRDGGRFYEGLLSKAAQAGVDRIVVGMFDEYNESTAIMPMSDDPPPTPVEPGAHLLLLPEPAGQSKGVSMTKPQVEFDLNGQSPAQNIPGENFSMRWEGSILPPTDGSYVLSIEGASGDKAALSLNDKKVLTLKNIGDGQEESATVAMSAGKPVVYRLEYTHGTGQGTFRLVWQGPSIEKQTVPASALVDAWGRFLTNEGKPADLYLKLTSEARDMINGKRSPTDLSIPPGPSAASDSAR
jgi:hypothetical protein